MRKLILLTAAGFFFLSIFFSCTNNESRNRSSVKISETHDSYQLNASYHKSKAEDIHAYIRNHIWGKSEAAFNGNEIDAKVSLDDQTSFYIKTSPGVLKIRFDKHENSAESCYRMKRICEGVKDFIAKD